MPHLDPLTGLPRTIRDDIVVGNVAYDPEWRVRSEEANPGYVERFADRVGSAAWIDATLAARLIAVDDAEFATRDAFWHSLLPSTRSVFVEVSHPWGARPIGHLANCGPFGVAHAADVIVNPTEEGYDLSMLFAVRWEDGTAPVVPAGMTRVRLDNGGRLRRHDLGEDEHALEYYPMLPGLPGPQAWRRHLIWTQPVLLQLAMLNGYAFPEEVRARVLRPMVDAPSPLVEEFTSSHDADDAYHSMMIRAIARQFTEPGSHPGAAIAQRIAAIAFEDAADSIPSAVDGWGQLAWYAAKAEAVGDDERLAALAPAREAMRDLVARMVVLERLAEPPLPSAQVGGTFGGTLLTVGWDDGARRIRLETLTEDAR